MPEVQSPRAGDPGVRVQGVAAMREVHHDRVRVEWGLGISCHAGSAPSSSRHGGSGLGMEG
eukprot:9470270-Pyramimonas_sp.AAC.1